MIDILRRIPVEWITSAELTGDMESKLDGVQRGTNQRDSYMSEIMIGFRNLLTEFEITIDQNCMNRKNLWALVHCAVPTSVKQYFPTSAKRMRVETRVAHS